jgi:hypothetical protein
MSADKRHKWDAKLGVLLSVTNIAQIARGNSGVQSDEDFQSIGKVLFGQLFWNTTSDSRFCQNSVSGQNSIVPH